MGIRIILNVYYVIKFFILLIVWIEVVYNYSKCKICLLFDLGNCFFLGMIIILDSGLYLFLIVC